MIFKNSILSFLCRVKIYSYKIDLLQLFIMLIHKYYTILEYYGANRSGRWAGHIIQLQNLPQNHMEDLEEAKGLVRNGDYEAL
mgnify:CR=1 FL=1